ncbi:hypothetical protein FHY55_08425 [Oceanicola sp. D3]|uniref:hypothetical protein n=1 Tax=Oceanicola sp. D3 TaxID=2587163 RepID=UPI001123447F|nr:hypothetical protein [Oceanicola sp. D3]QDC09264.1 hypothetical protein FHY55_08425 [Oceanicola sp. D3]
MLGLLLPQPARAEFTLIDRLGAWLFYTQRGVGASYAACQVVSCVDGTCGTGRGGRTQFSLYDARDGRGIFPEFIAPRRVPPGGLAKLNIAGREFVMKNTFPSPQFYLQVEDVSDAKAVLNRLVALERADRNAKFTVVDPFGTRFEFAARGVTGSLDRMVRRCTPRS